MALTNYEPRIAVVYASVTGNTKAVAEILQEICAAKELEVELWPVNSFPLSGLSRYDAVFVGTYTWGSGEIPKEMRGLFGEFESLERKGIVTAVFGTGDSFFAEFCGAVDRFRDMLYVHTDLAATLKIELAPQNTDIARCEKLIASVINRLSRFSCK
ncbi:flavodoxin domain-containing protein [Planococcus shenhongbingii]|uniref:Flavodoxin domain-containing protein n=1 Tax=Planococcus shenhongbingii TaxID=3058398 RepID=A0ABT8NCQ6_9BACL|nr:MULTISPECIES: flavodoxin domain-containing protein [unclassified Planococcus (in: firmicutes)]MDN7245330.1 flavodoxin domain-containing protein [Planococcus sp. N017]WKA58435.1 flavodoxin domain-containing protein [Planococcus sp. N016]